MFISAWAVNEQLINFFIFIRISFKSVCVFNERRETINYLGRLQVKIKYSMLSAFKHSMEGTSAVNEQIFKIFIFWEKFKIKVSGYVSEAN